MYNYLASKLNIYAYYGRTSITVQYANLPLENKIIAYKTSSTVTASRLRYYQITTSAYDDKEHLNCKFIDYNINY